MPCLSMIFSKNCRYQLKVRDCYCSLAVDEAQTLPHHQKNVRSAIDKSEPMCYNIALENIAFLHKARIICHFLCLISIYKPRPSAL